MNQKTLVLVATIAGFVLLAALVFLPLSTMSHGDMSRSTHAIEAPQGAWLLLFGWIAAGFSALVCFGKADYIGVPEAKSRMLSFLGYKLYGFFAIAMLIGIDMGEHAGFGSGFWIAFLAAIVGAGAVYLTFNEKLAQKLADKAKDLKEQATSKDDEGTPSDDTPAS